ncbi:competence protein CoiA [Thermogemmatispora sp.]|uniref:competence protein CoiA n=1 Tax=Thermogemmatispora sp. TaxID=1968838 RepID=UPI0035E4527A
MLVAYGPDGQPVVADERALSQLQEWSQQRLLFCPNCRAVLHLRGGPARRTQLHFAHRKGACPWSTEEESERHMRGKAILAAWLRQQFPAASVTLEERLPEPNRIADVFVTQPDGRRLAVEFQCAPLELDEWQRRHQAYQQAGITDLWIIGSNRRDKQEAFQEAILESCSLLVFLDPLLTPARAWLRWPLSAQALQEWQAERAGPTRSLDLSAGGWVGRLGYGLTLTTTLAELHLNEQGEINHPLRAEYERRLRLRHLMTFADSIDEELLAAYLYNTVSADMWQQVLRPLLRAYRSDPDLLRRYNYGRGTPEQPVQEADRQRVARACAWLRRLARQGFPPTRLREVAQEIPFVGPYAAFVRYIEMLVTLAQSHR